MKTQNISHLIRCKIPIKAIQIIPFDVCVLSLRDFFATKFPTKASPLSVTMATLCVLRATCVTVNCRRITHRHRFRLGLAACQTKTYKDTIQY